MGLKNKALEKVVVNAIDHLRKTYVSDIAPTPIRQRVDELLTQARNELILFDQRLYDKDPDNVTVFDNEAIKDALMQSTHPRAHEMVDYVNAAINLGWTRKGGGL